MPTNPQDAAASGASILAAAALDTLYVARWRALGRRLRGYTSPRGIRYPRSPVLLLPGVYEPHDFLEPYAVLARVQGRPPHAVEELRRNTGSIVEAASAARDHLERADLDNVMIVAHSKGGLIGKQLMIWPETSARITAMVAIATPFDGSRYARRAPTRALRAFDPNDDTIRGLAATRDVNARILSIAPRVDPQIPEGSVLEGARNVGVPVDGHFRVLGDFATRELVRAELIRTI